MLYQKYTRLRWKRALLKEKKKKRVFLSKIGGWEESPLMLCNLVVTSTHRRKIYLCATVPEEE